jgi:hypothetical protein
MTFIRIPSNPVALVVVVALFFGATVAEAATGSHWPLDEKSSTAARDIILDNDATLVNGQVWVSGKNNSTLSFD